MESITQIQTYVAYIFRENREEGLMHLEEAYAVEITKTVECVERKEDPLMQIFRTHQHAFYSAVLQTARRLKTEVQRVTR
jgi:predicted RNA-binding protein with RPS1 domain